jgi:hypothetical protein
VILTLNGWEGTKGEVVGYLLHASGWLMLCVKLDARPAWHVKEFPNRDVCVFSGNEFLKGGE